MCQKAERLAGLGLTKQQIAVSLGMASSTLFEKVKKYPEFSESIKRGRIAGISEVSNALFESASAGNITAMIFYLKNRAPESWSDHPQPSTDEDAIPASIEIHVVDGRIKDKDGNPIEYEFGNPPKEKAA